MPNPDCFKIVGRLITAMIAKMYAHHIVPTRLVMARPKRSLNPTVSTSLWLGGFALCSLIATVRGCGVYWKAIRGSSGA